MKKKSFLLVSVLFLVCNSFLFAKTPNSSIVGVVKCNVDNPIEYVVVYANNSTTSTVTNEKGEYTLSLPEGKHRIRFSHINYEKTEHTVHLAKEETKKLDVVLQDNSKSLSEVEVVGKSGIQEVRESAYNVVAIDAKALHNSTLDLAQAMAKVSGVKIRESGGVGSDVQFSLNGFTGRHVKFFIDGVPMEGMGSSFQINNIPINMAERIEIYKGVVPVGFGADALGGVVNIVTNQRKRTYVDASYSYGSFNTHRTTLSAGYTTQNGLMFEVNAFQNYSDNSYWIYNRVKIFGADGGMTFTEEEERVRRFHDAYSNQTLIGKVGFVNKSFADRLMLSLNVGKTYNEIQTAVHQNIVFGERHNKGRALMPSFVYSKRNLLTEGLDVNLTANFNRNIRQNVDTSRYIFNWRGESMLQSRGQVGERSYTDSEFENRSWNTTFNAGYRIDDKQSVTLNNVLTSFDRNTRSIGVDETLSATDTMPKISRKNVTGLSYRFSYYNKWNVSAFAKHYFQYAKGPRLVDADRGTYDLFSESASQFGGGVAATYFLKDFQFKASYEKAYRLPTDNEMFGDEDMEYGSTDLKPENSNNYNLTIAYNKEINRTHFFMFDLGFMYRDTKDYIHRVVSESGSVPAKSNASYVNYGSVRNIGFNGEVRYMYKKLITSGINVTTQDLRHNDINRLTGEKSTLYGIRIRNTPYFFANGDLSFNWHNALKEGNVMTLAYYTNYVHEFTLREENQGYSDTKDKVPIQFSHDISITYIMDKGRYNISLECKNLTDERLYDNYSLQKPGRAFYAKVRYFFNK